jgi:hypothetical protein
MSSGCPIEKGTPIRMPSVALLCVDSNDTIEYSKQTGLRNDSNTPASVYINRQRPLLFGYMTRVGLVEMAFEWGTPNVNPRNYTMTIALPPLAPATNPRIYRISPGYFVPSTTVPTPAPPADRQFNQLQQFGEFGYGWYSGSELAEALQTSLNQLIPLGAGAIGWIVRYRKPVMNFDITAVTSATGATRTYQPFRVISSKVRIPATWNALGTGFPALDDDLTTMMGLTPVTFPGDTASPDPINVPPTWNYYPRVSGGFASMVQTAYFDVVSNFLTSNQNVADGDTDTRNNKGSKLARIYLANEHMENAREDVIYNMAVVPPTVAGYNTNIVGCRPFYFRREFKLPKQIMWDNTENVDVIDIRLIDYQGNPLYIIPSAGEAGTPGYSPSNAVTGNTQDVFFTVQATET